MEIIRQKAGLYHLYIDDIHVATIVQHNTFWNVNSPNNDKWDPLINRVYYTYKAALEAARHYLTNKPGNPAYQGG